MGGGRPATVIGWGVTERGSLSNALLEATVPMVSDAGCGARGGSDFTPPRWCARAAATLTPAAVTPVDR